jgi:hypothetical protein
MVLRPNLTYGRRDYRSYRARIDELKPGEFIEIPDVPNESYARSKFYCAIRATAGLWRVRMRSIPNGGVRIYKWGQWASISNGFDEWDLPGQPLLLNKRQTFVRTQRPSSFYLGFMDWEPSDAAFQRAVKCAVRGCVHPIHDGGQHCYQHEHFWDYPMSMTDAAIDRREFWRPWNPHAPFELVNDVRPPATWALEKSLVFIGPNEYADNRHLSTTERAAKPVVANYSRSNGRLQMSRGHGGYTSSKTTRGRARAASRSGKGSHDSDAPKKWTRETIEVLERQADELLGITPEIKQKAEMMHCAQTAELRTYALCQSYEILHEELTEDEERERTIEQLARTNLFDSF